MFFRKLLLEHATCLGRMAAAHLPLNLQAIYQNIYERRQVKVRSKRFPLSLLPPPATAVTSERVKNEKCPSPQEVLLPARCLRPATITVHTQARFAIRSLCGRCFAAVRGGEGGRESSHLATGQGLVPDSPSVTTSSRAHPIRAHTRDCVSSSFRRGQNVVRVK